MSLQATQRHTTHMCEDSCGGRVCVIMCECGSHNIDELILSCSLRKNGVESSMLAT
jgi:hypothetical protein